MCGVKSPHYITVEKGLCFECFDEDLLFQHSVQGKDPNKSPRICRRADCLQRKKAAALKVTSKKKPARLPGGALSGGTSSSNWAQAPCFKMPPPSIGPLPAGEPQGNPLSDDSGGSFSDERSALVPEEKAKGNEDSLDRKEALLRFELKVRQEHLEARKSSGSKTSELIAEVGDAVHSEEKGHNQGDDY